MAHIEVKVPNIGDFAEVTVIELLVKAGDTVQVDQSLITVESDKASMEIPSSHSGVVQELKVKLGDKVSEGSALLLLDGSETGSTDGAPVRPAAAEGAKSGSESGPAPAGAAMAPAAAAVKAAPAAPMASTFAGTADLECDVLVLGGVRVDIRPRFAPPTWGSRSCWWSGIQRWVVYA